jgi:hypothetical protein
MRDKREAITVSGHQTGERVLAHDGRSVLREVELWGQIHEMTLPKQRHPKVPCLSFPLNNCRIPDDCIDSKRYPLFMAREVMRQLIDNLCVTTAVHPGALS